ncbi:MAG: protein NnrT [Amaricoccus sp.]|uniref:protein NnrT n=1 Tax=Amaricoccus sp. TaxID=1872485 RepID=UPI003314C220
MRRLLPLLALLPGSALAEAFTPPVPEAQTDAAALSYALAALGLVLGLGAAQWLIARR